jgi:hypothetical protein
MNNDEYEEMVAQHRRQMLEMEAEKLRDFASLIDAFKEQAGAKGVALADLKFHYSPPLGLTASSLNLLSSLLEVKPNSRDGLYLWDDLAQALRPRQFDVGCLWGDNFGALAHPSFRRQMHPQNNWAPLFVDLFWALGASGLEKSIALDPDRVRIDVEGPRYVELDTWYGPPFNREIALIATGNVKLRPPGDLSQTRLDMFFAGAYCVDVKWAASDDIKTFQALELKTESVQIELEGASFHPARYLHAEFDLQSGTFRHLDGAVQFLSGAEYAARRDSDFNMCFKSTQHVKPRSKKMFKLNGAIAVDDWVELSSHFFAANPLMFEYFNGALPGHTQNVLDRLRALPVDRR